MALLTAVAVDDDQSRLDTILGVLSDMDEFGSVKGFNNPVDALDYLRCHYVPVLFLDIKMPGINGLSLARQVSSFSPRTNIIFTSTYSHYLKEAFDLHASGYVVKPVTKEKLEGEISHLRYSPDFSLMGLRAQTFGRFQVFYDAQPVSFRNSKAKEVLAFLIDREGAPVSLEKIASVVFKNVENALSAAAEAIASLRSTFAGLGEDNILIQFRNKVMLDTDRVSSDLRDAQSGDESARCLFSGVYLPEYEWADDRAEDIAACF